MQHQLRLAENGHAPMANGSHSGLYSDLGSDCPSKCVCTMSGCSALLTVLHLKSDRSSPATLSMVVLRVNLCQWCSCLFCHTQIVRSTLSTQDRYILDLESMIVCAGELDQDHSGQNGFLTDADGGPDANPANVHLPSLRLDSPAHTHFNRSGTFSTACHFLPQVSVIHVLYLQTVLCGNPVAQCLSFGYCADELLQCC